MVTFVRSLILSPSFRVALRHFPLLRGQGQLEGWIMIIMACFDTCAGMGSAPVDREITVTPLLLPDSDTLMILQ